MRPSYTIKFGSVFLYNHPSTFIINILFLSISQAFYGAFGSRFPGHGIMYVYYGVVLIVDGDIPIKSQLLEPGLTLAQFLF